MSEQANLARLYLREHVNQTTHGRWYFGDRKFTHTEDEALAIVQSCLALDVPVTDVLTSTTWHRIVERLVSLDKRVQELELRR